MALTYNQALEVEPEVLRQMFLVAFGHYPVLEWHENWTMYDDGDGFEYDEPMVMRDFHLLIDTELLHKVDEFSYSYIRHLLVEVVEDKLRKPEIFHTNLRASRKYSFSDTEDWWDSITFKGDMGERTRFDVSVTIG